MIKWALKIGMISLIGLVCTAAVSSAETKYVAEEFEITMRTGPGTDNKIIALIPSGRQVEVIKPGDEWTEVQLANGKQGWVLSRYLTSELPNEIKLERLDNKYEQLLAQKNALDQSSTELANAKNELTTALSQTQDQLAEVSAAYESLKNESADFINLKKKYDSMDKELKTTRTHAEQMENDLNRLSNNQVYQGMLYGGGLLALGFIVGFIVKKPKKRSGLM